MADHDSPAELTEAQIDALADAGNRALNDHYHEELCHCSDWPESCASSGNYFAGSWDTAAFNIGMRAVIAAWEAMRAPTEAAELAALRERVEELETFAYGCDAEGCVLPHSSWCQRAIVFAESHNGCTCGGPWESSQQPHAGHCWLLSPPRAEVEQLRARVAELEADRTAVRESVAAAIERRGTAFRPTHPVWPYIPVFAGLARGQSVPPRSCLSEGKEQG
ncbi:hypothetical protein ACIQU4_15590 [Streptomyces sp. NPDC090741]|uniref:hypothetical protein n=1 Tax=Streptomyces sp. NPDC090741 TaxID=3365967 RepID=UPI0037FE6C7C